jgi:hypothetical protein
MAMARRRRNREITLLNNTSFLDTMANAVGALAFVLLLVVVATVALKLSYFPLDIRTEKLSEAVVGDPYNVVLAATGGNEPYRWELVEGELPDGLQFNVVQQTYYDDQYKQAVTSPAGKIHGTPREPTTQPLKLTVLVDDEPVAGEEDQVIDQPPFSKTFEISVRPQRFEALPIEIKTASCPVAVVGQLFSLHLSAVGGSPPYKWNIEGDVPDWLSLDGTEGRLAGTPSEKGEWRLALGVEDSQGTKARRNPSIMCRAVPYTTEEEIINGIVKKLNIVTAKIPSATAKQDYDLTLAAMGGIPPYRWEVSGELPDGLDFTNGRIHGRPAMETKGRSFSVKVMSAADAPRQDEDSKGFEITVDPAPTPVSPLRIFRR